MHSPGFAQLSEHSTSTAATAIKGRAILGGVMLGFGLMIPVGFLASLLVGPFGIIAALLMPVVLPFMLANNAYTGACPYPPCGKTLTTAWKGVTCPACLKRSIIKDERFILVSVSTTPLDQRSDTPAKGYASTAETVFTGEFSADSLTKTCPACTERIKLEALVCRFCVHKFEPMEVQAAIQQAKAEWEKKAAAEWEKKAAAAKAEKKKSSAEAREKLSLGLCPKCDAYMAFNTDATKNLRTCEVCGEQYPLVWPS